MVRATVTAGDVASGDVAAVLTRCNELQVTLVQVTLLQ
jgi:hypothetical protein